LWRQDEFGVEAVDAGFFASELFESPDPEPEEDSVLELDSEVLAVLSDFPSPFSFSRARLRVP
jgi:hypothetical protein